MPTFLISLVQRLLLKPCGAALFNAMASSISSNNATFNIGAKVSLAQIASLIDDGEGMVIVGRTQFPERSSSGREEGDGTPPWTTNSALFDSRVEQVVWNSLTARLVWRGPRTVSDLRGSPGARIGEA